MAHPIYSTPEWAEARQAALVRDGHRCIIHRLIAGAECHELLDVHHLVPVGEGGSPLALDNLVTVCHSHHPMLEALRRFRGRPWKRCRHHHRYESGRIECERKLNAVA